MTPGKHIWGLEKWYTEAKEVNKKCVNKQVIACATGLLFAGPPWERELLQLTGKTLKYLSTTSPLSDGWGLNPGVLACIAHGPNVLDKQRAPKTVSCLNSGGMSEDRSWKVTSAPAVTPSKRDPASLRSPGGLMLRLVYISHPLYLFCPWYLVSLATK